MNSSPSAPTPQDQLESSATPPNEPLSREDYLALAKVCRNMDNRDIDMHPRKDNPENYPDRPDYWANEIEMTPEQEDQLIEIYRWRIDNDLLSWDPVKASQVRRSERLEAETRETPQQVSPTPTASMKPDLQTTSQESTPWPIQERIAWYCSAKGIELTPEEIELVANHEATKPETALPLDLARKIWPVKELRNRAGLEDNPPPGREDLEDEEE